MRFASALNWFVRVLLANTILAFDVHAAPGRRSHDRQNVHSLEQIGIETQDTLKQTVSDGPVSQSTTVVQLARVYMEVPALSNLPILRGRRSAVVDSEVQQLKELMDKIERIQRSRKRKRSHSNKNTDSIKRIWNLLANADDPAPQRSS